MQEATGAKKPRLAPPVLAAMEAWAKKDNKKVQVLEGCVVYKKEWPSKYSGPYLDWKLHSLHDVDGTVTETWHGVAKQ